MRQASGAGQEETSDRGGSSTVARRGTDSGDGAVPAVGWSGTGDAPSAAPAGSESFEELLKAVLPRAYAAALHFTRDESDAEDLVQEAALMALRGFHTFRPGTNFGAWFLKVLHNAFLMRCRRSASVEKRTVSLDAPEPCFLQARLQGTGLAPEGPDPAAEFFSRLNEGRVSRALQALPLEYRAVAGLYFVEDLSYAQIAEIVGCPLGTVRSRLHRARALLQRELWEFAVENGIVPSPSRERVGPTDPAGHPSGGLGGALGGVADPRGQLRA